MNFRKTGAWFCLIGGVATFSVHVHAASDCHTRELPSVDCVNLPDSDCCKPISFTDSENDNRLCDQAHYWSYWGQGLTPTRRQQHNATYHVQTETFTDWPDSPTFGGSTWSQHYVNVGLLAGTVYESGKSWHSSNFDYSPLARAHENPFHQDYSTLQALVLEGEGDPGARWTSNWAGDGSIRLGCDYFLEAPVFEAAILVHESWHGVYGGHDFSNGGDTQDHYYPRTKDMVGPGEMNTPFIPLGSTIFGENHQSVYQTELYYVCDIMDQPANWLANRTIAQARFVYPALAGSNGGRLTDPAPDIVCGVNSLRASQVIPVPPAPGAVPRVIRIRILGQLTDGTPLGEATHQPIDYFSETELVPGGDFEAFPLQTYRAADDDTEFRFYAEARLVDDETVEVRFQGEFYEDFPDCEGDTSLDSVLIEGQQCMGRQDGHDHWRRFTLNSSDTTPPPISFDLNNCWDDTEAGQCEDFAQGTIAFQIDF